MGHISIGFKFAALLLSVAGVVAAVVILSGTFKAQALNVRTEIKANPPGIVKIIDGGKPPAGIFIIQGDESGDTTDSAIVPIVLGDSESDGSGSSDGDDGTSSNAPEGDSSSSSTSSPSNNAQSGPQSIPPGISNIIGGGGGGGLGGGLPPPGLIDPKGSRPTTLIINTDIEFGTVFPGESVTGEFTIYLTGVDSDDWQGTYTSITYNITLSNPEFQDMREYVIVKRDPSESDTEPDDTADGTSGDYTAQGSLDSADPADVSDKWFVTFYVPDDGTGDYGLTILVEVP